MICEGIEHLKAAFSSGMASLQGMAAEVWAGGAMMQCHCCISYLVQALGHTEWEHKIQNILDSRLWWDSPFTQQITLCFLYCFSSLWAFCLAVLLLIYVVATELWICRELDALRIIHILGFITTNLSPISYDYGSFNNISGMNLNVSGYRKMCNLYAY
jgi:hypothetical protein